MRLYPIINRRKKILVQIPSNSESILIFLKIEEFYTLKHDVKLAATKKRFVSNFSSFKPLFLYDRYDMCWVL